MIENIRFKFNALERKYEIFVDSGKPLSEVVDEFIKANDKTKVVITDDDTKRAVWKCRTNINNLLKEIAGARKQTLSVMTKPLENACLEQETKLSNISNELTRLINEYQPKEPKEKVYKLVITSTELKALKKIEKIAQKYSCKTKLEE